MKNSALSKNYALALADSFKDSHSDMLSQLGQVKETIASSSDLALVMGNTSVSLSAKTGIIEDIFRDKIDNRLLNFLKLLVEKGRFCLIDEIYSSCCEIINEQENKKFVEVVSAVELNENYKTKISNIMEIKLNSTVVPKWTVDESIIAGLIFKYDDKIVDTSLKSKLENLSNSILR